MNEDARQLITELYRDLEADPRPRLGSITRKAYRLAKLVGDSKFAEYCRMNLFFPGVDSGPLTAEMKEIRKSAAVMFLEDRRVDDGRIQTLPVDELYSLLSNEAMRGESPSESVELDLQTKKFLSKIEYRIHDFLLRTDQIVSSKIVEQKFKILWAVEQEEIDFRDYVRSSEDTLPIGVFFADLDDFKAVNASFTETVVDETILPQAQGLLKAITRFRGEAYRHGGEEFVLIIPNIDVVEAQGFADRICRAFREEEFVAQGKTTSITVSIGIALWPNDGANLKRLLKAANNAKNQAKQAGKDRFAAAWDLDAAKSEG